MNDSLLEKIKQLRFEECVWILYIGIIAYSFYSNHLEKHYYLYHDSYSKKKYRESLILIFSILTIVYMSFLKSSYDGIKSIQKGDSKKKIRFLYLSFYASLLIAVSGFIYLYIAYKDQDLNVEIAFN